MAAVPLCPYLPGLPDALGDGILDARSGDLAAPQIVQLLSQFQENGVPVSRAAPVRPEGE